MAKNQSPQNFSWREEPYEFENQLAVMDMLTGGSKVRTMLEDKLNVDELMTQWKKDVNEFRERRREILLYPEQEEE
jgi:uncharacterized protein YbbC (DUF1343 family)